MADLTVWGLVVLITLSEVIINTCNFIHGNSHGELHRLEKSGAKVGTFRARISISLFNSLLQHYHTVVYF
jgi:hypothetical protein